MRIAFDIRGIINEPAGKGVWTANTLKTMMEMDPDNEYYLYCRSGDADFETGYPRVKVRQIKGDGILWHWRFYRQMLHDKIDVFIASESYIVPFLHNPKLLNTGLVAHDLVVFKSPAKHALKASFLERFLLKTAVKKCRWIFAVSGHTRKDLIEIFPDLSPDRKITVVYAGTRGDFSAGHDRNFIINVQRRYGLSPDYLMMAGTLEPRKNYSGALEAYALLPLKHRQRFKLVIAGKKGWYFDTIFESINRLKLSQHVHFLDYIPDADIAALLSGAKLFLFPSFYEGFGLPVLEAMRSGTPVLTSPISSLPEIGGAAVHYADPYDPADIAEGILRMLEDEEYYKTLRDKGLSRAEKFTWQKTAGAILKTIINI